MCDPLDALLKGRHPIRSGGTESIALDPIIRSYIDSTRRPNAFAMELRDAERYANLE